MTESMHPDNDTHKAFQQIIKKMEQELLKNDKKPEFDPDCAETIEIEAPVLDENNNFYIEKIEAVTSSDMLTLFDLDELCTESGHKTCWEYGNFDRLHIFSKNLQRRACIHIEYTYVVDVGEGPKKIKNDKTLLKYLELKNIGC